MLKRDKNKKKSREIGIIAPSINGIRRVEGGSCRSKQKVPVLVCGSKKKRHFDDTNN